jgi:hypothetical protein
VGQGYKTVGSDTLANVMQRDPRNSVLVFATDYFPRSVFEGGANSPLRQYLVLLGNNPLFFNVDEQAKQIIGLNNRRIDSVLNLDYGPTDTRAFGGLFPGFPNEKGKHYGLPDSWVSNFGIDAGQVDMVLGENENGQASAFVKKYKNGGRLVQIWMHPDIPMNLDAIVKCAEWKMD